MAVARVLFLARYRVPHALFALQWDRFLLGIDYTVVATTEPRDDLWRVFDHYGIDTSRFEYLHDDAIYQKYPEVDDWVFADDYRTYWLRQQAIKLAYLDMIGEDVMLMHDPDTFMIEPYRCVENDVLNFLILPNTEQVSYRGMVENILWIPKPTPHCFVTELVPVKYSLLREMINHIEYVHETTWLSAIIDNAPVMPTVPPWGNGNFVKWFSEYELLANWSVHREAAVFTHQRRFEYDDLSKLAHITGDFNAVCDAVPDLQDSMQLDWETLIVPGFEHYRNIIGELVGN